MARIIVSPSRSSDDLSDCFMGALGVLKEGGLNPRAGTKLVSRYAVIVVDDEHLLSAIDSLRAASMQATFDP